VIQPLGVVPGPAGALLLPPAGDAAAAERVLRGDYAGLPEAWAFYPLAVNGDREGAIARCAGSGFLASYNRFALDGAPERYAALAAAASGDERLLADAAAFQHGVIDAPPEAAAADPLVRAYLLAVRGSLEELTEAADLARDRSPVFAGRLLAEIGSILAADPARTDDALEALESGRALIAQSAFHEDAAEISFQYGQLAHERADGRPGRLLAAVGAYQRALYVFSKDGPHRDAYAMAHMNLGLAYLALPMGGDAERLRPAIAIQSLREAAAVFDRERTPELWASATLNLANALQHAASTHVEDNLWEAVALYEDVLPIVERGDPLRRARVLANQGNALAHLGAFSRAEPRLREAGELFAKAGDLDATAALGEILREIDARRRQVAEAANGSA
jgi:tetratricopeptide (TPR) repeat protein